MHVVYQKKRLGVFKIHVFDTIEG